MTNSIGDQTAPQRREIFEEYLMYYDQAWQNGNVKVCNDRQVTDRARHVLLSQTDPVERFTTFDFYHIALECVKLGVRDCRSVFHVFIKATEVLETLCVNLFLFPWKKEIKTIKTFTGPFVYCVQPVFPQPVLRGLLESMGYYPETDTEYRLRPEADRQRARAMGFDMFLARVESQHLLEAMGQRAHAECLEVLTRRAGASPGHGERGRETAGAGSDQRKGEAEGGKSGREGVPQVQTARDEEGNRVAPQQQTDGRDSSGDGGALQGKSKREGSGGGGGGGGGREVEGGPVGQWHRDSGRDGAAVSDQQSREGGGSGAAERQRDRVSGSSGGGGGREGSAHGPREAKEKESRSQTTTTQIAKDKDAKSEGPKAKPPPLPDVLSLTQPAAASWEAPTPQRPPEGTSDKGAVEWDRSRPLRLEAKGVTEASGGVAEGGAGRAPAVATVAKGAVAPGGKAVVGTGAAPGGKAAGAGTGVAVEGQGVKAGGAAVLPGGVNAGVSTAGSSSGATGSSVVSEGSTMVTTSSGVATAKSAVVTDGAAQQPDSSSSASTSTSTSTSSSSRGRSGSFLSDDRSILEMRHNYPDLAIRQKPIFLSRRQRGGSYPTPGPKAPRSRLGDDGDVGVGGTTTTRAGQAAEPSSHQPHPISAATRGALSSSATELSVSGPHSISFAPSARTNNIISSSSGGGGGSSTQVIAHASDLAGPQSISSRNPMITSTSELSGPQSITIHHPKPLVPSAGCTLAPIAAPAPKAVSPVTPIVVPKPGLPVPVLVPVPAPDDAVPEPQPLVASAGPASIIHYPEHRATMAAVGQSAVARPGQQRAGKEPDLLLELTARLGQLTMDEPLKYPIEETQAQAQALPSAACSACHEHHHRHHHRRSNSSSWPAGAVASVAVGAGVAAPPTGQLRDSGHHQPILCAPSALPVCSISGCSSCVGPDVLRHHQHQGNQHSLHVGASTIKEPPSSLYMPPSPLGMCPPALEALAGRGCSAACPGPLGPPGASHSQQPEDELLQTYVLVEPDRK